MDRGAARARSNPQIAAELTHARSDAADANAWPERGMVLMREK